METFFLGTLQAIITVLKTIGILVDTFICNVFIQFSGCIFPKICFALLQPLNFGIKGLFLITIDLPTDICRNLLNLQLGNCQCDQCAFDSPISSFACALFNGCVNGKLMVPCNGKSVCNSCTGGYSILRYILLF